jgi:hypothetical protein
MYTVVVAGTVKAELAALWQAAGPAGREEALRAVTAINEQLTTAPYERSESRENDERVIFVLPVGARFEVHEALSRVNVLAIWYVRPRGKA